MTRKLIPAPFSYKIYKEEVFNPEQMFVENLEHLDTYTQVAFEQIYRNYILEIDKQNFGNDVPLSDILHGLCLEPNENMRAADHLLTYLGISPELSTKEKIAYYKIFIGE